MQRIFLVTVALEVIQRLRSCPPKHIRAGSKLELATFAVTSEEDMLPSKLKIRDRDRPVAGEIYRLVLNEERQRDFVDAATGKLCRSRDNVYVRLYPDVNDRFKLDGELRFFTCPKGTEPLISPAPVMLRKLTGVKSCGVWWIASPDTNYDVRHEGTADAVLFSGNVVVQLNGSRERAVQGAVAIEIANRITVYDRREDRMSSFARAEHVRRTVGGRSFEFINLRDLTTGGTVQEPPVRILTSAGLQPVE